MNKHILTGLFLLVPALGNAASITCLTDHWGGDAKAVVSGSIDKETREPDLSLTVDGKLITQAKSGATLLQKGKYKGMLSFKLGTVKGAGSDGGSLIYSLYVPKNIPDSLNFGGIVYTISQDGYGTGPTKVSCVLR